MNWAVFSGSECPAATRNTEEQAVCVLSGCRGSCILTQGFLYVARGFQSHPGLGLWRGSSMNDSYAEVGKLRPKELTHQGWSQVKPRAQWSPSLQGSLYLALPESTSGAQPGLIL